MYERFQESEVPELDLRCLILCLQTCFYPWASRKKKIKIIKCVNMLWSCIFHLRFSNNSNKKKKKIHLSSCRGKVLLELKSFKNNHCALVSWIRNHALLVQIQMLRTQKFTTASTSCTFMARPPEVLTIENSYNSWRSNRLCVCMCVCVYVFVCVFEYVCVQHFWCYFSYHWYSSRCEPVQMCEVDEWPPNHAICEALLF
jgi:hypothetical protein